MNYQTITREHAIELLLAKVEEVLNNNDWATEEGQERCDEPPCVIRQLVDNIRKGD
jgi:hypothetical protein